MQDDRSGKPRASQLAPLTEWRLAGTQARRGGRPRMDWRWPIAGVCAVLLTVIAVQMFSAPTMTDLIAATPVTKATAPPRRRTVPLQQAPIELPGGVVVDNASVMNFELARWLATRPADARTFAFDRLRFDPGSAELREADQLALQRLAQILTAYPEARATIVGNGPGDLGARRAAAIHDALLSLATDPGQVGARAGTAAEAPPRLLVRFEIATVSNLDA